MLIWRIFFRYENQREPPALVDYGMLRTGSISDILKCLEVPTAPSVHAHDVTAKVVDMAAVVHMVRPTRAAIFSDDKYPNAPSTTPEKLTGSQRAMPGCCLGHLPRMEPENAGSFQTGKWATDATWSRRQSAYSQERLAKISEQQ